MERSTKVARGQTGGRDSSGDYRVRDKLPGKFEERIIEGSFGVWWWGNLCRRTRYGRFDSGAAYVEKHPSKAACNLDGLVGRGESTALRLRCEGICTKT